MRVNNDEGSAVSLRICQLLEHGIKDKNELISVLSKEFLRSKQVIKRHVKQHLRNLQQKYNILNDGVQTE